LEELGAEAVAALREERGYDEQRWQKHYAALDREHGPTAYIFRCRHCGRIGGYSDYP
jgi:uncharacterized protein CbrC (UPF0167 family)